jgi:hypothetical protein
LSTRSIRPRCRHTPRYEEQRDIAWSNAYTAQQWYAGGASRPELQAIAVKAFSEFGVPLLREPNVRPPLGDLGRFFEFLPGVATSEFLSLLPHRPGDAGDGPLDRPRGLDARVRANHRRGE